MKNLLSEIRKIRRLMELQNTELKVKMQQGVNYMDAGAMDQYGQWQTFTGDEIGKILPDPNVSDNELKIQLDDGRIVLTTPDAVADVKNLPDANTQDGFINGGTNDGGTYAF